MLLLTSKAEADLEIWQTPA